MGENYVKSLRNHYKGAVPGGADLVTYWFEKSRAHIAEGKAKYAGLVATNSIRGGSNRKVLERIRETGQIFEAWSDEPWINNGAAVRVSLICFGETQQRYSLHLDGHEVSEIYADLTGIIPMNANSHVNQSLQEFVGNYNDLTKAKPLKENAGFCFMGASKKAPFDIPGEFARSWLNLPNPNGRANHEVLRPLSNAMDLTRRSSDTWIIDFGTCMTESEASLYEIPFQYVVKHVQPQRMKNRREAYKKYWWRHAEARPGMRSELDGLARYIATPAVSKHRVFVWKHASVLPDQAVLATVTDDDITFGILHSRFHELWSLKMCTWMGVGNDPRYTPSTCFETFPFPKGLTPKDNRGSTPHGDATTTNTIAAAAKRFDELRNQWLNPPEWVDWVITPEEEKAGYPRRAVAKPGFEAELKKRTLTNLYNARPAWLDNVHKALNKAVADAYGWTDYTPDMPDEEILRRLLRLNLERSALQY